VLGWQVGSFVELRVNGKGMWESSGIGGGEDRSVKCGVERLHNAKPNP